MTICIAAKCDVGVVCITDTAVTYGDNRFSNPGIKGMTSTRWKAFIMYSGETWAIPEILHSTEPTILLAIKAANEKYKDSESKPVLPVEFLHVHLTTQEISILDEGAVFGPFPDFACIGAAASTAWPLLEALYKRIRVRSIHNTKKMLFEVVRLCEKYDPSVYRPFICQVIP
jgi:hypothetical protein